MSIVSHGALLGALLPVAALFLVWDVIAIAADVWWYNPRYIVGPDRLPVICRWRKCCSSWWYRCAGC